jgi:glycosyltransferase involved in cell wall biosynthesis
VNPDVAPRLRILVVSPYLPSRRSGGHVRLRGLVSNLAESHDVSILAFADPTAEGQVAPVEIPQSVAEVVTVPLDVATTRKAKRALQLRSLLSPQSFERLVHQRPAFQAALDHMSERRHFDVVHVEHCFMAHFAFPHDAVVVLDEQNVEYEVRRRSASVTRPGSRKLYDYLNHLKLRREEEDSWRSADACAATSPRDEAAIREACPTARTAVVANAVDTEFFSPGPRRPDSHTVLFFGTLAYYPNVEALLFFMREVMPLLRRSHPTVQLRIVGAAPPPEITRLAGPDVVVTGFVDDVRPHLERASVIVAPLRIGGGTRLKILEAMAMGRPVVSTTLGAEGLAVTHGREVLIGDSPEAFAGQVTRVLDDDSLAISLGAAGRRLVEAEYDWRASTRALEALYRGVLHARGQVATAALTAAGAAD